MKKMTLKYLLPAALVALLAASSRPVRADEPAPASVNSVSDASAPAPDAVAKDGADVQAKKKHKKKHKKARAAQPDSPAGGAATSETAPAAGPGQ